MMKKSDIEIQLTATEASSSQDNESNVEDAATPTKVKPKHLGFLFVEKDQPGRPRLNEVKSDLLTSQEAAAYLRCSVKTLYNYKCNGKLKGINIGGTSQGPLRFKKSDLDIFLFGKRGA